MSLDQDKKILDELARRVRVRYSEARIWLFGSRARGDSSWDSDFDVCIVLINANEDADKFIRPVVWEVGFENERVITTIVLNEADFSCGTMSESTLVENILREGIAA